MRIATIRNDSVDAAAAVSDARGIVRLRDLEQPFRGDLLDAITELSPKELARRVEATPDDRFMSSEHLEYVAPYRRPRKILGIGLNFREHAEDLNAPYPESPASFIKGDHTIIGFGDAIPLPEQSRRVTAEAELALVIGKECFRVDESSALDYVWGVVPALDQTAEDILQENPRFLTRSKNFPGFFSFGPEIVSLDEVTAVIGALAKIRVATMINGQVHRENLIANLVYGLAYLVSFHSHVMPLFPGDLISTGTPGAVTVRSGDIVEADVQGVGLLRNVVV